MSSLFTPLCTLIQTRFPIIQAPMAGGPTTPALVASVSNSGALGSLGAGYMTPEAIREAIHEIKRRTDRPFGVNLFIPSDASLAVPDLAPMKQFLSQIHPASEAQFGAIEIPSFEDQLAVVLAEEVPVFSFTFGQLGGDVVRELQNRGTAVVGTATTVEEAFALQASGVDAVVAQGYEAGGHRGTFLHQVETSLVGTMALIPQIVNQLHVPVIASGGIMDGRGIAASLMLGAAGVQLGTAFLVAQESGAHPAYKRAVVESGASDTVLTNGFSGKVARAIRNHFTEEIREFPGEIPPYPMQNSLTRPLRNWAAKRSDTDYMSLFAGQGAAMGREIPAAELVHQLVEETKASLLRGSELL
ncbi:nitronate monooxygenase [Alicyclobacillus fastidiosus]|uniref:Probable nitronate monooxygenase n=1 Tax=Alicyclobacillus fastidiosus TaxID=392011 RepID=A0ABY6ZLK2_9BACL|nr:nitronate monooxygenase [Alicyclobacillus fastidiosus]WAH43001.1 nitronate monooxygenase [Alicyclobacillus fastidiosus]GMA64971.1 nitronate monooxygenase [Alicyclobacillus fastidiosus]